MTGLFVVALTVFVVGTLLLAGFGIAAGLLLITKGPAAAKQFIREEW